jgi:hypothetical protein
VSVAIRLTGGPHSGTVDLEGLVPTVFYIPVDKNLTPTSAIPPFAITVYDLRPGNVYAFRCFQHPSNGPFEIEFVDGPAKGAMPAPQPIQCFEIERHVCLNAEGKMLNVGETLGSVAIYERDRRDGEWKYYLKRIDTSPETLAEAKEFIKEQILTNAINKFYEKPDYDIYKCKPTDRHVQVAIQVGHRRGEVDERIAPLIEAVWRLGLDTMGSCEDRPQDYPRFPGMAYIWFPRLKDAKRFEEVLKNAGIEYVFDPKQSTIGWKPEEGIEGEKITFDGANILFAPSDIDRIVELLRSKA